MIVATVTYPGRDIPEATKPHRQSLLRRPHRAEREAAVVGRRVEPPAPLVVRGERPRRQNALRFVERRQEVGRRLGHAGGDVASSVHADVVVPATAVSG